MNDTTYQVESFEDNTNRSINNTADNGVVDTSFLPVITNNNAERYVEDFDVDSFVGAPQGCEEYTVQVGDTLESIAKSNNTTIEEIRRINNMEDYEEIYAGETIFIPMQDMSMGGDGSSGGSGGSGGSSDSSRTIDSEGFDSSSVSGNNSEDDYLDDIYNVEEENSNTASSNRISGATTDLRNLNLDELLDIVNNYKDKINELLVDYDLTEEEFLEFMNDAMSYYADNDEDYDLDIDVSDSVYAYLNYIVGIEISKDVVDEVLENVEMITTTQDEIKSRVSDEETLNQLVEDKNSIYNDLKDLKEEFQLILDLALRWNGNKDGLTEEEIFNAYLENFKSENYKFNTYQEYKDNIDSNESIINGMYEDLSYIYTLVLENKYNEDTKISSELETIKKAALEWYSSNNEIGNIEELSDEEYSNIINAYLANTSDNYTFTTYEGYISKIESLRQEEIDITNDIINYSYGYETTEESVLSMYRNLYTDEYIDSLDIDDEYKVLLKKYMKDNSDASIFLVASIIHTSQELKNTNSDLDILDGFNFGFNNVPPSSEPLPSHGEIPSPDATNAIESMPESSTEAMVEHINKPLELWKSLDLSQTLDSEYNSRILDEIRIEQDAFWRSSSDERKRLVSDWAEVSDYVSYLKSYYGDKKKKLEKDIRGLNDQLSLMEYQPYFDSVSVDELEYEEHAPLFDMLQGSDYEAHSILSSLASGAELDTSGQIWLDAQQANYNADYTERMQLYDLTEKYFTIQERNVCDKIYHELGEQAVFKYLYAMRETLRKRAGYDKGKEIFESIIGGSGEASRYFKLFLQGTGDGFSGFVENINAFILQDFDETTREYAIQYFMQFMANAYSVAEFDQEYGTIDSNALLELKNKIVTINGKEINYLSDEEYNALQEMLENGQEINGYDILYVKGLISEDDYKYSKEFYKTSEFKNFINTYGGEDEKFLSQCFYSGGSSFGNMIPSIVLAIICKPLGVAFTVGGQAVTWGQIAAGMAMFASSATGSWKDAKLNGHSDLEAILYGTLNGAFEVATEYLLGSTPFVSRVSRVTQSLVEGQGNFIVKAALSLLFDTLGEITEESAQVFIEGGLKTLVLGEDVSIDSLIAELPQTIVSTIITTGVMNGSALAINVAGVVITFGPNDAKNIMLASNSETYVKALIAAKSGEVDALTELIDSGKLSDRDIASLYASLEVSDRSKYQDVFAPYINDRINDILSMEETYNESKSYEVEGPSSFIDRVISNELRRGLKEQDLAGYISLARQGHIEYIRNSFIREALRGLSKQELNNLYEKYINHNVNNSNTNQNNVSNNNSINNNTTVNNANNNSASDRITRMNERNYARNRRRIEYYNKTNNHQATTAKVVYEYADKPGYNKVKYGIKFVSETTEGVDRLIRSYEEAIRRYPLGKEYFERTVQGKGLIITDINYSSTTSSYFGTLGDFIYLNLDKAHDTTVFHEYTHYLDQYTDYMARSAINKAIKKVTTNNMQELRNGYEIFKREYNSNNDVYRSVSDIFDALFGGTVFDYDHLPGHGSNYYDDPNNPDAKYVEILANVGALYNANRLDLLYKYFPKSFCDSVVKAYEKMVKKASKIHESNYYTGTYNDVSTDNITSYNGYDVRVDNMLNNINFDSNVDKEKIRNTILSFINSQGNINSNTVDLLINEIEKIFSDSNNVDAINNLDKFVGFLNSKNTTKMIDIYKVFEYVVSNIYNNLSNGNYSLDIMDYLNDTNMITINGKNYSFMQLLKSKTYLYLKMMFGSDTGVDNFIKRGINEFFNGNNFMADLTVDKFENAIIEKAINYYMNNGTTDQVIMRILDTMSINVMKVMAKNLGISAPVEGIAKHLFTIEGLQNDGTPRGGHISSAILDYFINYYGFNPVNTGLEYNGTVYKKSFITFREGYYSGLEQLLLDYDKCYSNIKSSSSTTGYYEISGRYYKLVVDRNNNPITFFPITRDVAQKSIMGSSQKIILIR